MSEIYAAPLEVGSDEPHDYEIWVHQIDRWMRGEKLGFHRIPLQGEREGVEKTLKLSFGEPSMLQVLKALWGHAPEREQGIRLNTLVTASLIRVYRNPSVIQHRVLTRDVWVTREGYRRTPATHMASPPELDERGIGHVAVSRNASYPAVSAPVAEEEMMIYSRATAIEAARTGAARTPVYALVHHLPGDPYNRLERLHVLSESAGSNM